MINTIFRKYALTIASALLFLLGVLVAIDYVIGSHEARMNASRLQYAEARASASQLQLNFRRVEAAQLELSSLPWIRAVPATNDTRDELRRFLKTQPLVTQIDRVTLDGSPSAYRVSLMNLDGALLAAPEIADLRRSNDRLVAYQRVLYGKDGKFAQIATFGAPADRIALSSQIDLRFVDQDVRSLRFGETGTVYLVDGSYRVMAHSDARFALRPTFVGAEWASRGWDAKSEKNTLSFVEGQSLTGKPVMAVALKLEPQGWWLIAEQDSQEALAPVRAQLYRNVLTMLLGALFAVGLAYLMARRWSAPIKDLNFAANRLSEGNFGERVLSARKDELGGLARSFNNMATEIQSLTTGLEQKIAEKTSQLETEFVTREAQGKEIVKLEERARIMRDFHDGVGGHLVSLLGAAKREALDAKQIEAMVADALVDFRIAIDSLSPEETDMTTALAGLRFRLTPRLQAAGLESAWSLADLPEHMNFSRETIFHVQRIVTEAITNAIKHSGASRVDVSARVEASSTSMVVDVVDDGVGYSLEPSAGEARRGRGVSNILKRAEMIGGEIAWLNGGVASVGTARGTVMRLRLPVEISIPKGAPSDAGA